MTAQLTGELAQIKIFQGLAQDELLDIAAKCRSGSCSANEVFLKEGDKVTEVYFVKNGRLQVEFTIPHALHPDKVIVEVLGPGELFAWSALVSSILTASVRSLEQTEYLAVNVADLMAMCERKTHMGYVIMRNVNHVISSRLEKSRQQLILALQQIGENW